MDRNKLSFKLPVILLTVFFLASCAGGGSRNNTGDSSIGVVSSVTVTNTIETSGNLSADKLATLKWDISGIVEKVNVKAGDKVKTNDVLASLRLDSVLPLVALGPSDLATDQRALQDMLNSTTSLAQAQLDVLAAQKAVETAQNNWDGLAYPRATDALIKNTQAKIWAAQKRLTLASKNYKEVQNDSDGDPEKTAALLELTNAQLALNDLNALYNWYVGKPTQADYDQAKAKLDVARAALEDARRTRDNVKNGADPLKIAAAKAKVISDQAAVNTMNIIAPFDGEVLSVQAGVGNSVNILDSAVELVDRQTLKVETQVDETSISSVAVDNPAKITMDSLPNVVLTGKVARINRIGTTVNGLVKYTVVVSVDPTDKPVLFGATVNVTITTGSPQPMLAVPINAIQTGSNNEYVIVVRANGSTQRVTVVSGDLVGNLVTITTTGDLKKGDKVQLATASSDSSGSNNNSNPGGGGEIRIPGGGGGPGG